MSQSLSNTKENVTASGLRKFAKEYTMLLFVIVLVIACMLFVDRFATPGNLMNVLIQIAINALIATGMTFVILSDGIDLSVGSVAALAGVVATATIKMFPDAGRGLSVLVILLAAIVVGVFRRKAQCPAIYRNARNDEHRTRTCLCLYRFQAGL